MDVRDLREGDEEALSRFFGSIPAAEHAFFKEDLDDPAVLARWIGDERSIRLGAFDAERRIAAIAAVWPGVGRSAHVGDLRLIVARDRRRQGLGQLMARHALIKALDGGVWKLMVEVVAAEQGTIDMFMALGFVPEALLRDQLCSPTGEREDVVLLAHLAEEAGQDVLLAAPEEVEA